MQFGCRIRIRDDRIRMQDAEISRNVKGFLKHAPEKGNLNALLLPGIIGRFRIAFDQANAGMGPWGLQFAIRYWRLSIN